MLENKNNICVQTFGFQFEYGYRYEYLEHLETQTKVEIAELCLNYTLHYIHKCSSLLHNINGTK